jgi:hypothetical protein
MVIKNFDQGFFTSVYEERLGLQHGLISKIPIITSLGLTNCTYIKGVHMRVLVVHRAKKIKSLRFRSIEFFKVIGHGRETII